MAPTDGALVRFGSTRITITIPNGNASGSGAIDALRGLLAGQRWVGLLDASNSELSGNDYGRVAIQQGAWTYS